MKFAKNVIALALIIALPLSLLAGCTASGSGAQAAAGLQKDDSGKLSVITTLFPLYEFTRQIAGDKADVTLLLPPGVESHSFEPTPADIIEIDRSDLFIYTGAGMEAWADRVLDGIDPGKVTVLETSSGIPLEKEGHHEAHADETHTDSDKSDHDEESESAESEEVHLHEFDPHIWTSPILAQKIVDNILASLCEIDPENAELYTKNAASYQAELDKLDDTFRDIVDHASRKVIYFGGRFALLYFVEEYGLEFHAAFDSCSSETEPSAAVIAEMIDGIREHQIPVVYYEELAEPKVAQSLSKETGAEMLLLHSCHNVSKEEFDAGVTYLDLMKQNAENLRKGLQ